MIPFEMNSGNFGSYQGGGACDGTRLVAGGIELLLAEHAGDAATLGLWHLHDGVWTDASGNGHTLSPSGGASLGERGAAFARASSQRAVTDAFSVSALSAMTIEAWARLDSLPGASQAYGIAGAYYDLRLWVTSVSGQCRIIAHVVYADGTSTQTWDVWPGADTTTEHHLAVVWQRGTTGGLRIYLDGVLFKAADTADKALYNYGSQGFYVGSADSGSTFFDGRVDEVRLSSSARYSAAFAPERHVASGTFTSPAFDCERRGALWLPEEWSADVPATCNLAFEVRAGDTLDVSGDVEAAWQSAELADEPGRYAQWRATLGRSSDATGRFSPTVESVTAQASEAGANLYHGAGDEAASIDYATPLALFGPAVASHDVAGLACPAVHWFGLRSVTAEGQVTPTVDAEVRLELDAEGDEVPPRPASVESLEAVGAGGGCARLSWLALAEMGDAPPEAFRIYGNGGSGDVDFDTPLGEVPAAVDGRQYQWTSAAQAGGLTVTFAVRAETSSGGVDAAPSEVTITIDAAAPLAAGHLGAATVLSD